MNKFIPLLLLLASILLGVAAADSFHYTSYGSGLLSNPFSGNGYTQVTSSGSSGTFGFVSTATSAYMGFSSSSKTSGFNIQAARPVRTVHQTYNGDPYQTAEYGSWTLTQAQVRTPSVNTYASRNSVTGTYAVQGRLGSGVSAPPIRISSGYNRARSNYAYGSSMSSYSFPRTASASVARYGVYY